MFCKLNSLTIFFCFFFAEENKRTKPENEIIIQTKSYEEIMQNDEVFDTKLEENIRSNNFCFGFDTICFRDKKKEKNDNIEGKALNLVNNMNDNIDPTLTKINERAEKVFFLKYEKILFGAKKIKNLYPLLFDISGGPGCYLDKQEETTLKFMIKSNLNLGIRVFYRNKIKSKSSVFLQLGLLQIGKYFCLIFRLCFFLKVTGFFSVRINFELNVMQLDKNQVLNQYLGITQNPHCDFVNYFSINLSFV